MTTTSIGRFAPVTAVLTVILLSLPAPSARAIDGVTEINQAVALQGLDPDEAVPADPAGFPVKITKSGSYRLTGNLDVSGETNPQNVTAIKIETDGVTLDLNGFAIIGPCVGTACAPTGTGVGVKLVGSDVAVFNGHVRGMASHGLELSGLARVENIQSIENRGTGIKINQGSVSKCQAHDNGMSGITCTSACVIDGNMARGNVALGITCSNCTATRNMAFENGGDGISGVSAMISGNTSTDNDGDGINGDTSSLIHGNVVRGNGGWGLDLNDSGYTNNVIRGASNRTVLGNNEVEMGEFTNMCNTNTTCP